MDRIEAENILRTANPDDHDPVIAALIVRAQQDLDGEDAEQTYLARKD